MPPSKQSKKPQKAPGEESVRGSSSKGTQPQKVAPQRPPTEESVQGASKGKKPPKPPFQQAPAEASVQGSSEGKQVIRPRPEQPVQAGSSRENHRQLPPEGSTPVKAEVTNLRPEKERVQPGTTEGKRRQKPPPPPQPVANSEKAKGKQPMLKSIRGNPRFFILRIPVKREGPTERVEVSIGPDTAFRHPQTFFFKNIPLLEPFWGYANFRAFTAARIVRLEHEEKATPYFLMVCRGEHPEAASPPNNNAIFLGMDEPIFGDAFVFKLGDPELYGDGYARYVNIEEDFDWIDWVPEAIRMAARKVEKATARHANPGFPDLRNYADKKTMSKDAKRMFSWMREIRKANKTFATPFPIDVTSGMPVVERMNDSIGKMNDKGTAWRDEDCVRTAGGTVSLRDKSINAYVQRVYDFNKALEEARIVIHQDETLGGCSYFASSDTKTILAVERASECYMAVKSAFELTEAMVKVELVKRAMKTTEPSGEVDMKGTKT